MGGWLRVGRGSLFVRDTACGVHAGRDEKAAQSANFRNGSGYGSFGSSTESDIPGRNQGAGFQGAAGKVFQKSEQWLRGD